MLTSLTGPLVVTGQTSSPISGQPPTDYNADVGPSAFAAGTMLLDPRCSTQGVLAGFYQGGDIIAIDQVPATLTVDAIAVAANVVSGTAMTLVSSSAAGITVTTSDTVIAQTGKTVPSGALCIDVVPAAISFGTSGRITVLDPRKSIARAVNVTGSASATGGNITVVGYDLYGFPLTEVLAAPAGATTVNGKKAFKFVVSVTPAFTDAHNYSIGLTDIYGFPIAVYDLGAVDLVWNAANITATTGFVAAVTTDPATTTTGDVRGTYAVQSASDATKRLQVTIRVQPWNAGSTNGAASLFGIAQI